MIDTRCWRYRAGEARIFASPDCVPEGQGWVDSPARIAQEPADAPLVSAAAMQPLEPKRRGRPPKAR